MPKRILQGTVVSASSNKTILVSVVRKVMHPVYKKYIKKTKKYAAHDEKNISKVGQNVKIQENKPISKTKKWILINWWGSYDTNAKYIICCRQLWGKKRSVY